MTARSPGKAKGKRRGLVVWAMLHARGIALLRKVNPGDAWRDNRLALLTLAEFYRAGCPRLKPGEVRKVKVSIEEVK